MFSKPLICVVLVVTLIGHASAAYTVQFGHGCVTGTFASCSSKSVVSSFNSGDCVPDVQGSGSYYHGSSAKMTVNGNSFTATIYEGSADCGGLQSDASMSHHEASGTINQQASVSSNSELIMVTGGNSPTTLPTTTSSPSVSGSVQKPCTSDAQRVSISGIAFFAIAMFAAIGL